MKRKTAADEKDEILSGLGEARGKIMEAVSTLPPERCDEVFLGVWSIRDLLAHLQGWDVTNLAAAQEILAGKVPAFYAYHDRDWAGYNARLVKKYNKGDFSALLASVGKSHQKLLTFLRKLSPEDFERDRGLRHKGYRITIARLLRAEAEDEQVHCRQIQDFAAAHVA